MEPSICWQRNRWAPAMVAGMLLVSALFFGGAWLEMARGDRAWLLQVWWLLFFVWGGQGIAGPLCVLTDGVLVLAQGGLARWPRGGTRHVPLGTADLRPTTRGWYVHWADGDRRYAEHIIVPPAFAQALAAAIAGEGGMAPRTIARAEQVVQVGAEMWPPLLIWGTLLAGFALLALAGWQNQPLWLLLVVPLITWPAFRPERRCVLTADALLVVTPQGVYARIPVPAMTRIRPLPGGARLFSGGASLPLRGADLIRTLRSRLPH